MNTNSFNFVKALKSHYFRQKSTWFFNHFTFYAINYKNWHHDIHPIIFVMWCTPKYTHGLNINYLNYSELLIFFNYILPSFKNYYDKGGSWYIFYHLFIKRNRMFYNVIRKIYRTYRTILMYGYVVGNGIFPISNYKKIYMSMNIKFNLLQENFNKKFNLGNIQPQGIKEYPKHKEMQKIIGVLRNIKKWSEGITLDKFD